MQKTIPIQPTGLLNYLSVVKNPLIKGQNTLFYVSWKAAFRDLILAKKVKLGTIILLPEFYCTNTAARMNSLGLHIKWYSCSEQFYTDPVYFKKYIEKYRPTVIVVFNPLGITNSLFQQKKQWVCALPSNTILIEDCANRLINPKTIKFINENHILIDSLRKVSPLYGARIIGSKNVLDYKPSPTLHSFFFKVTVLILSITFQLILGFSSTFKNLSVGLLLNSIAERIMVYIYTLQPPANLSIPGPHIFEYLSHYFRYSEIEKVKITQVSKYEKLLEKIWKSKLFFKIKIAKRDFKSLRGYPVGVTISHSKEIRDYLRKKGLLTVYELNECLWSKKQKVFLLPLGTHIDDQDISFASKILVNSLKNSHSY